ncbi:hybrid sensor histidine kinase/response regulator [Desulfocurvibacter africanus]|uniref:histidine kinase n=3 Tax=Desulfocurvibacter africanus TaxID=873 RepID=F3Z078_DESAF|nr:response regulator [Desulfocurvibacter africanus]EGJ49780.1 CheA signal transduction histidine kinase [Desulfocurvibacter africanus subsp. africanus str. Walvis Bay]
MGEAAFLRKLRRAFAAEAEERLSAMESALMALEAIGPGPLDAENAAWLETFYRDVHSLKGASRTVDAPALETVCQPLESALGELKAGRISPSPAFFDLLHKALKVLRSLLSRFDPESDDTTLPPPGDPMLRRLAAELAAAAEGREPPAAEAVVTEAVEHVAQPPGQPSAPSAAPVALAAPSAVAAGAAWTGQDKSQMLRLPSDRLERLLSDCEEFLPEKLAMSKLADEAGFMQTTALQLRKLLERMAATLDQRGRGGPDEQLADRLAQAAELAAELNAEAKAHAAQLAAKRRDMTLKVDTLLDDLKQALTLPFSRLLERFPKMIRDLAHELGKQVDLAIEGQDMEIDRRILDQLHDPLLHLLRNAVDHGIETPEERRRVGKPEQGHISVRVRPLEQDRMEVVVADDGRGIDRDKVLEAAKDAGLLDAAQAVSLDQDAGLELIFRSGMSTRRAVTDISGRGLGLAIAHERVERLGGALRLETRPGQGVSFHMTMPLSFSSFPALAVLAGGRTFLLAKSGVERVLLLEKDETLHIEGREAVPYIDQTLPLVDLAAILGLPMIERTERDDASEAGSRNSQALVLAAGQNRLALRVEALLGEQEVMVKSLGSQLRRVRNVAGITLLGDGSLAAILHTPDLVASGLSGRIAVERPVRTEPPKPKTVLVVEDSVTSRMLLKAVLESSGYRVFTAVDGQEALVRLRGELPDVVVSDVQMPRMDGLELTRRIREDKVLAALPVILVTSLDSPADRERGVDAGANAYIVKSSFDQGNLLETVRRLA